MPVTIIIADDHAIVRHGTAYLIKDLLGNCNIFQTEDFPETLSLLEKQSADLLIFDVNMPGGDNFQAIAQLRKIRPALKILVFSAYSEDLYAIRYLKAGANGYINKNCSEEEVKQAIQMVLSKGKYISQHISHRLMEGFKQGGQQEQNPLKDLSNRETEVATLLIKGLGLLEISNHLNIQMSTVSTYKTRLYEKLGINNVPDLINLFKNNDLIA